MTIKVKDNGDGTATVTLDKSAITAANAQVTVPFDAVTAVSDADRLKIHAESA